MKHLIMGLVSAMAMGVMAEITNTVTVTRFHQLYPYSGKATLEYTVGGTLPANVVAKITLNTDDASATFVQSNIVTGANSHVIDFASSFGGALLLTNASFVVTIAEAGQGGTGGELGGVQLWENGPYWAECNVGATKPEDYGYYFWWGDTVGYKRENNAWVASDGSTSNFSFTDYNTSTYNKDNSALLSAGYIDSTGNLVAAHDAATAHLGSPWRMPTGAECSALINNCTAIWTTTNGVYGRLVTGKGDYANRNIFLPAAGYGYNSYLDGPGWVGYYWSSTPGSVFSSTAWFLFFQSSDFIRDYGYFDDGRSVRPVRGFAQFQLSIVGIVTYDPPPMSVAPVISPASGTTFANSLTVTISCETEGAAIYYTTDGSEPTKDSTEYRRFKIYGKTTVKAVAYSPESGLYSAVTSSEYALGTCANPVIAPDGGSAVATEGGYVFHHSGQTVTISWNGEEGTIRYTLDGTDPTAQSAVYSGAITLDATTTVKAKVFSDNYFDSEVVTVVFVREWAIGDTMGAPDHAFSTSGDNGKAFYRVSDATAPNGEAMHSGDIGNSGAYGSFARTVLSTTVTGPGTVSFSWKASCENDAPDYDWDHGEFAVDGVVGAYISGETGWTNVSVAVTGAGEHTLTWTYLKDDAEGDGEDCIWVAGYGWASTEAYTHTTVVPVPYAWLRRYDPGVVDEYEAYEASALATAANGRKVWECYVVGLDPSDPLDDFRITRFWMEGNMPMFEFNHTTDGSGNSFLPYVKPLGKANLADGWRHVPDGGNPIFRFFAVEVVPPGGESVVDDGVQLWENGPYWAKCNVGASKPEEYGYYFWWGDTVGYKYENGAWVAADGSTSNFSFSNDNAPTCGKNNLELLSDGYIDSTGNLVAAHDAATAHLGAPWRMPTSAEIDALVSNCTTTWIATNGVYGRLVTGKGDYAGRSIFLPAAGYGDDSILDRPGSYGGYWSSSPNSGISDLARFLYFYSSYFTGISHYRYDGQSVRPVRGSAQ